MDDLGVVVIPRDIHAELRDALDPMPHGPLVIGVDPAISRRDASSVAFSSLYGGKLAHLHGVRLIESEPEESSSAEPAKKPKHHPSRLMMSLLSRALPPKPTNWGFFHPPKENSDS
jgi:hypothetical protein